MTTMKQMRHYGKLLTKNPQMICPRCGQGLPARVRGKTLTVYPWHRLPATTDLTTYVGYCRQSGKEIPNP